MTKALNAGPRAVNVMMEGQAPIAVVGLLAIGVIVAVNFFFRPPIAPPGRSQAASGCKQCGTVVAVRRSAHSVPVTFVEVRMNDGSIRTVRAPGQQFSVGDAVEVSDDVLKPRNPS